MAVIGFGVAFEFAIEAAAPTIDGIIDSRTEFVSFSFLFRAEKCVLLPFEIRIT